MNVKKMFASLTGVLMLASMATPLVTGAATYSEELQGAYEYAYSKGITTMSPIDNANMYGELTRGQLSKMISNWAESELGRTVDETAVCSFTDTNTAEGDLATYVVKACQMGLMGQGITAFRPNDKVTRGEFGTTLSRAIWGDKYDGANPYYANHLAALSQEGIMTKISEPNNLEIRGWVMLMLQRAATTVAPEECKDAAVVMACALDPESDACPVACRKPAKDDETTDNSKEVVKAGDLQVTAVAAEGRKVIVDSTTPATSDLDTINLKASEAITLNSVTLERYGYSTPSDIEEVWLEDSDGNEITSKRSLSSTKDSVTLSIKKDYRELDAEDSFVIVVTTSTGAKVGGTLGFKVTDVDSSAKNVNLSNYSAYQYDMVTYDGSSITAELKGKDRTYNFSAGEAYEVAKLRISAHTAAVLVNGFKLTQSGSNALDLDKYVSKVEVLADGKAIDGLKTSLKRDELKVNFDDVEVAINKNVQFAVKVTLNDDFDEYGEKINLVLDSSADVNAVEKKNGTRVTTDDSKAKVGYVYTFRGGEIKLSNKKISSSIDAAQGSEDIVIGEGEITISEPIRLTFAITPSINTGVALKDAVNSIKMFVGDEEYEANNSWTFKDIVIEESGKVQFVVDLVDNNDIQDSTITFTPTTFGYDAFTSAKYDGNGDPIDGKDFVGTIDIAKIKVQPAKGTLKNNLTKKAEFITKKTTKKTVFEGTYTAKKQDVYLNEFEVLGNTGLAAGTTANLYLTIGDEEDVATIKLNGKDASSTGDSQEFSDILVKKGEAVKVKLVAEIYAASTGDVTYTLTLKGEDVNGVEAGGDSEKTVKLSFVEDASVTVSSLSSFANDTIVVTDDDVVVAKFIVKASNNAEGMDLNTLEFSFTGAYAGVVDTTKDAYDYFEVEVDGQPVDDDDITWLGTTGFNVKDINTEIPTEGIEVAVTFSKELTASASKYQLSIEKVNDLTNKKTFTKSSVNTLVAFRSQEDLRGDETKYIFDVDYTDILDSDLTVERLVLVTDESNLPTDAAGVNTAVEGANGIVAVLTDVTDGKDKQISNASSVQYIRGIAYVLSDGSYVAVKKSEYGDFFKTADGDTVKIFKSKDN